MNKTELIKAVAEKCEMPANQVSSVLNALMDVVTETVKSEEDVKLPGFGTFKCKVTAEHTARNPATQGTVVVPANKKLVFSAGSGTKNL